MTDTSVMQDRIGQLCGQFKLPTMGAQSVARFTAAGHGDALATFLEVLEQEAEDRRHRRINRLRRESRLPSGKTWETFEHDRVPLALRQQLDQLAQGSFVERGINVLAFGLPGTGKTHALCALGHRLVEAGHSVLFAPAYRLVQELLAAKRVWTCPASCASWTTSTSCSSTTWATCPRAPRNRRSSSPSSPNATSAGRWASRQTWSSRSGSASLPTPWPPPRRLTGSCTTPSSWSLTSPATGPTLPSNGARPRR